MIDRETLLQAIPRLAGPRLLVVGDLFLDAYLLGRPTRLSREAPIPVLEFEEQRQLPGGAANPAANIVGLGGSVTQVGVIGGDAAGQILTDLLKRAGIGTEGLVVDRDRPTTTKTRVVARGSLRFPQQVARIDHLDRRPLSAEVEAQVVARIQTLLDPTRRRFDMILVSDYRSGMVTPAVMQAVQAAQAQGLRACVDSQGRLGQFTGFELIKCNLNEAREYIHRTTGEPCALEQEPELQRAMTALWQELRAGLLLITRGPDGLSLQGGFGYAHLPAANRSEVYDVTGAGDTVIAVAGLALAAGLPPLVAAALANYAAGLVVRRLGVAAPSAAELAWAVESW
jgi:D-glycero-beta-D-manno-heptose-7-phosphate kinase